MIKKIFQHFKTITKHKYYVMIFMFKCGYYKRGILHDLSKYSLTEFIPSVKYFQGNSSPIDAEKQANGYSLAWLHHRGHNPHHWEYWIDNFSDYLNTPCKIPKEYVIEMICDWLSAGIVYSNNKPDYNKPYSEPLDFYLKNKKDKIILHPETREIIEYYLSIINQNGINYFCKFIKMFRKDIIIKNEKI